MACRDLAEKDSRDYSWKNGLLIQSIVNETLEDSEVIVLPKCKRTTILNVAHDKLGHLGYRKVLSIIHRNFVWPRLAADVKAYCESYTECQKCNRVAIVEHLDTLPCNQSTLRASGTRYSGPFT